MAPLKELGGIAGYITNAAPSEPNCIPLGLILADLRAESLREFIGYYLHLSSTERERAWNFVQDGIERDREPLMAVAYAPVEDFAMFARGVADGETPEQFCACNAATPEEYDRLLGAWETIREIHLTLWRRAEETMPTDGEAGFTEESEGVQP